MAPSKAVRARILAANVPFTSKNALGRKPSPSGGAQSVDESTSNR